MMRFIDLGKQIGIDEDWPRQFAFYNTITDRFVTASGAQVFDSWNDFIEQAIDELPPYLIERLRGLCQPWALGTARAYEDTTHAQDCQLRYITPEQAAAQDYGCTCKRVSRAL